MSSNPVNLVDPIDRCVEMMLPQEHWITAARMAIETNPRNKPEGFDLSQPTEFLAGQISKYWGPDGVVLTVRFLESLEPDLRQKILSHMNAWSAYANVRFVETAGDALIRVTTSGTDYQSFVGTDLLAWRINQNLPTMWLGGFDKPQSDAEFARVVRHEAGHALGFPHEHRRKEIVNRIIWEKAIDYYKPWPREKTIQQVLTPLPDTDLRSQGLPDEQSIMCYKIRADLMTDNKEVLGGKILTQRTPSSLPHFILKRATRRPRTSLAFPTAAITASSETSFG